MYDRILIAYDGSADGHAALSEGAEIALIGKADVTILAVIDVNVDVAAAEAYASGTASQEQFEETRALLDEEIVRLRQLGVAGTAAVAFGRPAEQIAEKAREIDGRPGGYWASDPWAMVALGKRAGGRQPAEAPAVQPAYRPAETVRQRPGRPAPRFPRRRDFAYHMECSCGRLASSPHHFL